MVQRQAVPHTCPGKKKKGEEWRHSQGTKSLGDTGWLLLLLPGLWLDRRTLSPTENYDCPTLLLPHTAWPIFHGNLGSVPWSWGGFAAAPTCLMLKTAGCLHLQCLHIRAGLTDWFKTCSESNEAFLAGRRPRSRCASAIMHVHNIDLCIPVNLDMCWTGWINCLCVNAWHSSKSIFLVLVLDRPCMHDLVA